MKEVERMIIGEELRTIIASAIQKACIVVGDSMGPGGKCAVISKIGINKSSTVTKDGVTIMNNLIDPDSSVHAILQLIKQTSEYSRKTAGDGTTASIVLLSEIYAQLRRVGDKVPGFNMTAAIKGAKKYVDDLAKYIDDLSIPVTPDSKLLKSIIEISSNGDQELADAIFEAYAFVGDKGLIGRIQRVSDNKSLVKAVCSTGFQKNVAPFFIANNNPRAMPFGLDDPFLLSIDSSINLADASEFIHWVVLKLGGMVKRLEDGKSSNLVLFMRDIDYSAYLNLMKTSKAAGLNLIIYKVSYGDRGTEELQDIAAYAGGSVIKFTDDINLDDARDALGRLESISTVRNTVTIFNSIGDEICSKVDEVIEGIQITLDNSRNEFGGSCATTRHQEERIAAFSAREAVIKIGSISDAEWVERRDRAEDAIQSAKAALEEGIVSGGGWALAVADSNLEKDTYTPGHKDEDIGYGLMKKSILAPLKRIHSNIDLTITDKAIQEGIARVSNGEIFDAYNCEWVNNAESAGIYDPLKVIMTSLTSAVTGASTLLNTSSIINTTSISTSQVDSKML